MGLCSTKSQQEEDGASEKKKGRSDKIESEMKETKIPKFDEVRTQMIFSKTVFRYLNKLQAF